MDLGRFLVEAVIVSGVSPTELARSHPISRSWLFRLLARYKEGGYEALEPRAALPRMHEAIAQIFRLDKSGPAPSGALVNAARASKPGKRSPTIESCFR